MRLKRMSVIWLSVALSLSLALGTFFYCADAILFRPWRSVERIRIGMDQTDVVRHLGRPSREFTTYQDLAGTHLAKDNYAFVRLAGVPGEQAVGPQWRSFISEAQKLRAGELPPVLGSAYWYDLPLTAGVLLYFRDSRLEAVFWGGT
jgi:hypothetical protein